MSNRCFPEGDDDKLGSVKKKKLYSNVDSDNLNQFIEEPNRSQSEVDVDELLDSYIRDMSRRYVVFNEGTEKDPKYSVIDSLGFSVRVDKDFLPHFEVHGFGFEPNNQHIGDYLQSIMDHELHKSPNISIEDLKQRVIDYDKSVGERHIKSEPFQPLRVGFVMPGTAISFSTFMALSTIDAKSDYLKIEDKDSKIIKKSSDSNGIVSCL
jgi:hypothetical protein